MLRTTHIPLMLYVVLALAGEAHEIGFAEDFALAEDRAKVLKQLIPGTDDYYYYHCLYYQQTGALDKIDDLVKLWIERHGRTPRVEEVLNRQALLTYDKDPKKTLDFLRWRLGLRFDHARDQLDEKPNLPTRLDPARISRETLTREALARHSNLQGFDDTALEFLATQELNGERRRDLLTRLTRPDLPNLPKLVVDDLKFQHSAGFGSLPIHRQMLLAQLDECLRLMPELLNQTNFVHISLLKLQPTPDVDIEHDAKERQAYLERLWTFVQRLAPAHNSLKAHVLHSRLVLDRSQGVYDKNRFMEYLKLPRQTGYMKPEYLRKPEFRDCPAQLGVGYPDSMLPLVPDDEPLVRDYLMSFFVQEETFEPYAEYLRDDYLKEVFAETKIVNGIGDMEKWYSLLNNPAKYQRLKDRIDIDFVPTNKTCFRTNDPVNLDLDVKNVKTLLVKVFEINALNYYLEQKREVDSAVNLDGLVANEEKTYAYEEPPLRRVRRHFEFPALKAAGVYVVEFIGNGMSSRAVIRKGRLRFLEHTGTAGHVFTVLDEDNKAVPDARLWLDGHEYKAGNDGAITVPFSTKPDRQAIVLSRDRFATLDYFEHKAETYRLQAGFYVDREALLKRRKAQVAVRPALSVNDMPATVALLEDVSLVIQSTNRDQVGSTKEVPGFKLSDEKEAVYEFLTPDDLASLSFTLKAKVKSLSENKKLDLTASQSFNLNAVDRTDKIESLLLSRADAGYVLQLLGKSGEVRPDRPVNVALQHRNFREAVHVALQTDAAGRIQLGALTDIVRLSGSLTDGQTYEWPLTHDDHSYPAAIHGKAGQVLRVPYMGTEKQAARSLFALLERRGTRSESASVYVKDWLDSLAIADGFLELKALPTGDYDLFLKETGDRMIVRVTEGETRDGYVLAENRLLETVNPDPLQIASVEVGADALKVRLKNVTASARLHVAATVFMPAYSMFGQLGNIAFPEPATIGLTKVVSSYQTGRNIGDEYRYILERRYAAKFPGNMLKRPALLLNPWALTPTGTSVDEGQGGGTFGGRDGGGRRLAVKRQGGSRATESGTGIVANLDYLPEGAVLLANLTPDKDGVVTIARKDLGAHQCVRLLAADNANTVYREVALPEAPYKPVDLRLAAGLEPAKHFTEQRQVSVVEAGQVLTLDDVGSASVEPYDSLARAYTLYATLSGDARLAEFRFVLNWPALKPEEKRANYSKYACHELSFFLSRKDPEFFKSAIVPYLKNKKDKTFMDRYLVGDDLAEYLQPWAYARLNVVEQILLAQRLQAERAAAARDVKDRYDLLPPNLERQAFLFKTAMQSSALETTEPIAGLRAATAKPATAEAPAEAKPAADAAAKGELLDRVEAEKAKAPAKEPGQPPPAPAAAKEALKKADAPAAGEKREQAAARRGLAEDLGRREEARQFYRKLEATEELAENNYYKLPIERQNGALVTANAFWHDYAAYVAAGKATPFLSPNLAEASRNFTEIMCALAVLDVPFEAGKHETEFKAARMTLTAKSPLVAYHKEIKESAPGERTPVLVSQNFYRHDDRYRHENNERFDKYVTDEFLVFTVYGCQVVLTNPTSSPQKLDLLLQIPRGALPVLNGFYTKGHYLQLQPYSTATFEYSFYFPAPGAFPHYPVHVAKNGKLTAFAPPVALNVVSKLTKVDNESWEYVSQRGTDEQVVAYLNGNNLYRPNLDRIAWRMKNAAYCRSVLDLLAKRHIYNHALWSYGVQHDDAAAIREFLTHDDNFIAQCGRWLDTKLLTIDPVARHMYQHLEYSPLVNARAHRLGKAPKILNERFYQQYLRFLEVLRYKPALDDADRLATAYYLLLQDRIEEGMAFFKRVDPARIPTRLQYDYAQTYVDFFSDGHKLARPIAQGYKDLAVDRWRNLFSEVLNQLDEAEGKAAQVADAQDRGQAMGKLATTAPTFDFKVEAQKVLVDYQNLAGCEVNYYPMDIELLFSTNPFVREVTGQFAFIRPIKTDTVKFPENGRTLEFELPKEFQSSNVMVELAAAGMRKSQAYYAHALALQVIENYGQVKVTGQKNGQPLPKAYVKVYAKMKGGGVQFYKDGYTDLRGRFDYASLSTNELDNVDKLALLVMSETDGAVIREAAPPKR
ncbi:MAG: hypothetical protein NTW87_20210 [Planctomycetota bacterium]|nr:hypothetical protein [Planctomycetota bacterium]